MCFLNQFGISGRLDTWITLDELYGTFNVCFIFILKQVLILYSGKGE